MKDIKLSDAFSKIISIEYFSGCVTEICNLIHSGNHDRIMIDKILAKNGIKKYKDLKEELIDVIILYINIIVLEDDLISENELKNIKILKNLFKIDEGDFYKFRYDEIKEIIRRQLYKMYIDKIVDSSEALQKVGLQELFDLSYDQFLEIVNIEDQYALERGANIEDLDTFYSGGSKISTSTGRYISQDVKDMVWRRDEGKCAVCGSQDKIEFDHIIPLSRGGSNTYRNIQLLCEKCNQVKSAKIG